MPSESSTPVAVRRGFLPGSRHFQASAPYAQAIRKGQRHPNRVGRAIRLVAIKRQEHLGPALLETHLAPPGPTLPYQFSNHIGALCMTRGTDVHQLGGEAGREPMALLKHEVFK
jgi:hypothetical protein